MLQALSRFTSHSSGCTKGAWPHWRSPTSNCATISASPMFTMPSPFTSPQAAGAVVVVVVVLVVAVVDEVVVVEVVVVVVDVVVVVVVVVVGPVPSDSYAP